MNVPSLKLEILYEDNHCLAVVKPARLLVAGDQTGDRNLLDLAKEYLKEKYQKPGECLRGAGPSPDRPGSRESSSSPEPVKPPPDFRSSFELGASRKSTSAPVEGIPEKSRCSCRSWLLKEVRTNLVQSVPRDGRFQRGTAPIG